jgi:Asp-tRNA(Asn)/Glu-tRNA(Gln) amidotransferase A subunit family amidase
MVNILTWSGTLLTPATTGIAPTLETTGDPIFNSPWSYTGLPTVSFPVSRGTDELPLAVQCVGASEREHTLLADAAWVERIVNWPHRLPPVPTSADA